MRVRNFVRDVRAARLGFWGTGLLLSVLLSPGSLSVAGGGHLQFLQQANSPTAASSNSEQNAKATAADPEQSTSDRYQLSPERAKQARDYSRTLYSLYFVRVFVGIALLILMLQ